MKCGEILREREREIRSGEGTCGGRSGVGGSRKRGKIGRRMVAKVPEEERGRLVWGRDQNDKAGKREISGQRMANDESVYSLR